MPMAVEDIHDGKEWWRKLGQSSGFSEIPKVLQVQAVRLQSLQGFNTQSVGLKPFGEQFANS